MRIINLGSSSKGNAVIVEFADSSTIMFDCGFSHKQLLRKSVTGAVVVTLPEICCLTHDHKDHSKGLADLQKWGVEIVREDRVEPFFVKSFDGVHDTPVKGFAVRNSDTNEVVLYATDTSYIPPIKGLTHMIIECNYDVDTLRENSFHRFKDVVARHYGLDDVLGYLELCDTSKLEEIYLCHTSSENLDPRKALTEVQQLTGFQMVPVLICRCLSATQSSL